MLLHLLFIAIVAIWMTKIAEKHELNKKRAVLFGVIGNLLFYFGVHFSLIVFGEEIYDNSRLIFGINVLSGFLGTFIVSLFLRRKT